ncbi:MAG TPA: YggT family protein [Thermomicrobiales bacterium]|nr:YggT family protein [Thermomicrobiales bacterium]
MALILDIVITFLQIMTWAIVGRALISWVDPRGTNPISRFLFELTEPIVGPIRSVVPRIGMIDISPIFAILLLQVLARMLSQVSVGA